MKKLVLLLSLAASFQVFAADHEVKMLNFGDAGSMVFEPDYIKIQPGDTVTFKATNTSHFVESKTVPEGADKFLSELDQDFTVKLDKEGVYVYVCPPHRMMNMTGLIQVGNATNKEQAEKMVAELSRRAMQNKDRLQKAMAKVQ